MKRKYKKCPICGKVLPIDSFYVYEYAISSRCKDCNVIYNRNRYREERKKRIGVFYSKAKDRLVEYKGSGKSKMYWSPQMIADLKRFYPDTSNADLSHMFRTSTRTVMRKGKELGLCKSKAYLHMLSKELGYLGCIASKKKQKENEQKQRLSENSERKKMERA